MHFVYKTDNLFQSIRISYGNSSVTKGFHFLNLFELLTFCVSPLVSFGNICLTSFMWCGGFMAASLAIIHLGKRPGAGAPGNGGASPHDDVTDVEFKE